MRWSFSLSNNLRRKLGKPSWTYSSVSSISCGWIGYPEVSQYQIQRANRASDLPARFWLWRSLVWHGVSTGWLVAQRFWSVQNACWVGSLLHKSLPNPPCHVCWSSHRALQTGVTWVFQIRPAFLPNSVNYCRLPCQSGKVQDWRKTSHHLATAKSLA